MFRNKTKKNWKLRQMKERENFKPASRFTVKFGPKTKTKNRTASNSQIQLIIKGGNI